MRRLLLTPAFFLAIPLAAATDAPPAVMHAGPVYTAAPKQQTDPASPVFPKLQIRLEMPPPERPQNPPETILPGDLHLVVSGQDCGAAIAVQTFEASGHGMAVAVTLDVSGSMKGAPLRAIRNGLMRFVDDAGKQDQIAIQTVADEGRWDAPWSAPRDQVRAALQSMASRGRLTRLWDGLLVALESFNGRVPARRLIVISDGHDEGSTNTEADVIALARAQRVSIDAVGMTRSDPKYLQNLAQLASATGGQFRPAASEPVLEQLISTEVRRLHSLPIATFVAQPVSADGRVRDFRVTWKNSGRELSANVAAVVPDIATPPHSATLWIVWILVGMAVIAGASVAITMARRKRFVAVPLPPIPVASSLAAAISTPAPIEAAGPSRMADQPMPRRAAGNPRDPFVPEQANEPSPEAPKRGQTQIGRRFPEPSSTSPAAWLVCEEGPLAGSAYAVDRGEFWIGALPNNHLQIADDPTVSGNHACVVFENGVLGVVDYQSTNGTRVNGERIGATKQFLHLGDRIRIGKCTFILRAQRVDS